MTTKLLLTEAENDLVLIFTSMIWLKFIEWLVNSGPGSKKLKTLFSSHIGFIHDACQSLLWLFQKPVDESMVDLIISCCNAFFEPFIEKDHKRVANIEAYSRTRPLDENGVRYHKPASSINENVLKYLVDFSGRQCTTS